MTKVNQKEFWEEKYLRSHMPWDIGQVAPAFVKYFNSYRGERWEVSGEMEKKNISALTSHLSPQKFVVLGCGRGHDAFYIAKLNQNFNVHGFDFAENAVNYCNQVKEKEKLQNTNFTLADFFELTKTNKWKNYFDYVIEHTSLAAIDPNRRKEYVALVNFLLKSKGKLIGLFFIRPKELGGPPFGISISEVRELFKDNFTEIEELHYEDCLHKGILEGDEYFGVFEKI